MRLHSYLTTRGLKKISFLNSHLEQNGLPYIQSLSMKFGYNKNTKRKCTFEIPVVVFQLAAKERSEK